MIYLENVTLVAVTSVALDATVKALELSMRDICFANALLLSDRLPSVIIPDGIEWKKIDKIESRDSYSRFIIDNLFDNIYTEYALIVQWDGYVINGSRWIDDFLQFDYIGAPWPQFDDGNTVGNGGFSLRSKRLLNVCRGLPLGAGEAEDVAICRTHRARLEKDHGLRFAPESLARRFAYERTDRRGSEFGFHGVFNMMRDMPRREFAAILATLERGLLGRRERREVLRGALRSFYWPMVVQAFRQRMK